jgi:hypothetical protein
LGIGMTDSSLAKLTTGRASFLISKGVPLFRLAPRRDGRTSVWSMTTGTDHRQTRRRYHRLTRSESVSASSHLRCADPRSLGETESESHRDSPTTSALPLRPAPPTWP